MSASRRTDIPSCHAQWFMERVREGTVQVSDPMNPKQTRLLELSPELHCFLDKRPAPLAAVFGRTWREGIPVLLPIYPDTVWQDNRTEPAAKTGNPADISCSISTAGTGAGLLAVRPGHFEPGFGRSLSFIRIWKAVQGAFRKNKILYD